MESHHLEHFALAADRAQALEQWVPGSDEYYYHLCLVHEQAKRYDEVEKVLETWARDTELSREIRNRLALLRYPTHPRETLEYLKDRLGLRFDHQREIERETRYPSALDPKLVSHDAVREAGYAHCDAHSLSGFTDAALEWLIEEKHEIDRCRSLLSRLKRPDHPKIPQLVIEELKDEKSRRFGSLPIHGLLLQDQLDRLIELWPDLRKSEAFVHTYLTRLHPGPDSDWEFDPAEREAYLERLWSFVKTLSAPFDPLKAHVLYHRLDHDRRAGVYDRARFLEYVKLPRRVPYADPDYLEKFGDRTFSLGTDYRAVTLCAAFSDDEELVRDYLDRFFREADSFQPYDEYMSEPFLKRVFATTKLLHGIGKPEKWTAMLDHPGYLQSLKDRVEIEFALTNRPAFGAGDPVALEVDVKNVQTLVVKVYEIHALNYILATGREPDTSIDLDGLVAGEEKTYTYSDPPLRRMRRRFEFPSLARPGVYVVEFIGGGISSRALLRKGRLRFLERSGSAGHAFRVLDEKRNPLKDASIWLSGREFRPGEDGEIRVPFSTAPGRQPIVLRHGDLATLETFEHQAERYDFVSGLYVDREALLRKREAAVIVRPSLRVNGIPVSLELLEDRTLVIQSTDRDGVSSTLEVRDVALRDDRETTHSFQVPENLTSITFTLRGRVQSVSENRKVELSDSRSFSVNGIDAEAAIQDFHLARTAGGFVGTLLGKTGEPRAGVPVNLTLRHRDITASMHFTLQTDAEGRVELGPLEGFTHVTLASASTTRTWPLPRDEARLEPSVHVRAGEPFRIPVLHGGADRRDFSLLSRLGSGFVRDHFAALSRKDGYLEVAGLPAGDYDLLLKREGVSIAVRAVPGKDEAGWIVGERRHLERGNDGPLHVSSVKIEKDRLEVRLGNATGDSRVHVLGTRYLPAHSAFEEFGRAGTPPLRTARLEQDPSRYVSGRDIGDEYRYILERRLAKPFPGNLLPRPGLLLNPWAVRSTETATQPASGGSGYGAEPRRARSAPACPPPPPEPQPALTGSYSNLDFLAHPAAVLVNLKPDANGVVTVPRDAVAHANQVRILAVDRLDTVCRDVWLPEVRTPHQDLRLRLALDPDRHFTEKRQVTVLDEGQPLEIADLTTSKTEVYDTLSRVYRLFAALSGNATLDAFAFVVRWPSLPPEEKLAKYSEFACHELNFFLSRKDPEFFRTVVQPYLRHKKDKTFLDHYLLGDDLSAFRRPWEYGRLNIVERILLAQRFDDEGDACARHVGDLDDLLPPDAEGANRLFQAGLGGSALDAGDVLGIQAATTAAEGALPDEGMDKCEKEAPPPAEEAMLFEAPPAALATSAPSPRAKKAMADRGGRERDRAARAHLRSFYQKVDKTQEWAENNYYRLPIEQQGPELVTVSPFWRDYARHLRKGPFLSPHVAYAGRNFTEMMFALAVLDLPFEAEKPQVAFEGARMRLVGKTRSIAFHKEIKPAEPAAERVPVLVGQNYLRDDDRFRHEGGEQHDKYVTGDFLVHVVYVCRVVLTNTTSTAQRLDLLLQIPQGAVPVRNGFTTRGLPVHVPAYSTKSFEYAFYFPSPGTFPHYPVHVAKGEKLVASAEPARLRVVRELSAVDKTSWAWLSQHGDAKDVLRWLEENNIDRLEPAGLAKIAWRMRDRAFYEPCLALLSRRHVYHDTLWSYSVHHDDARNLREFLLHREDFLDRCGLWLDSPLVRIDPVARRRYEHLEYAPLVNARAHRLGARHAILNDRFAAQHRRLMTFLRYRSPLSDDDRLAAAYVLFLQDRVAEGLDQFERVNGVPTALQRDYLKVYADLYRGSPEAARETAAGYRDYPVIRWRNLFRVALAQIDEISDAAAQVVDDRDRDQKTAKLASTEPDFDFAVEKRTVTVRYRNVAAVHVNYYRMEIELLFSRQPFVQQQTGQFSFIRPNRSDEVRLPAGQTTHAFELPAEFHGANVIVEIAAEGRRKSQAVYAHELLLQVIENYGQLRVAHQETGRPLPMTYVKVYARMKGGEVRFYKDGYTDLRGVFDYASLNTNELDYVERFAILILHAERGAVIREAAPPKR